jgi:hypothetical protein
VEPRTLFKGIAAFLVGVLLTLGAAIVHSRQGPVASAVHPVAASTRPAVKAEAEKSPARDEPVITEQLAVPDEPPPKENAKPDVPEPVQAQTAAQPARKNDSAPVQRRKNVQFVAGVRDMHPQPGASRPVTEKPRAVSASPASASTQNPWSVPVPPPPPSDSVQPTAQANPSTQTATPRPDPHVVTLPAGTTLSVRLRQGLSSDHNNEGDTFQASLDAPVISDGFIIAERRSQVIGRVVEANRAGRVKGLANLAIAVTEINTTDGQRVPVETDSYQKWGNSSGRGDVAKVAGGAALGAIIGAIAGGGKGAAIGAGAGGAAGTGIALGTRGGDVAVPSESILTFRLARPITITEKFN